MGHSAARSPMHRRHARPSPRGRARAHAPAHQLRRRRSFCVPGGPDPAQPLIHTARPTQPCRFTSLARNAAPHPAPFPHTLGARPPRSPRRRSVARRSPPGDRGVGDRRRHAQASGAQAGAAAAARHTYVSAAILLARAGGLPEAGARASHARRNAGCASTRILPPPPPSLPFPLPPPLACMARVLLAAGGALQRTDARLEFRLREPTRRLTSLDAGRDAAARRACVSSSHAYGVCRPENVNIDGDSENQ